MSEEIRVTTFKPRSTLGKKIAILTAFVIILAIIVGILVSNIVVADVGEAVAIIDPFAGRIVNVIFGPAWTFKAPWQYTKTLFVAVHTLNFLKDNAIDALTKDGAMITVEVTVRYEVKRDPGAVKLLISNYPIDPTGQLEQQVMTPIVKQVVRDVISHYKLVEIIEKREELSKIISRQIYDRLINEPTIRASIRIIEVNVRSVRPPQRVIEAIENKLRAQQEAEAAKYMFQREVTLANASRMRQVIEAMGTMEALQLIARAFGNRTDLLAWYVFVQNLRYFNGTLIIILVPSANMTMPTLLTLPVR